MGIFLKLSKLGIPFQEPRLLLPGWRPPPDGFRRWLRAVPFRALVDKEGWELANARMNPSGSPRCERCPTHLLYVFALGARFSRLIGDVCDDCGTLRCGTSFDASDGPWAKLGWRHEAIAWLPGDFVGNLHDEFLEWFRGPPHPVAVPATAGPYR